MPAPSESGARPAVIKHPSASFSPYPSKTFSITIIPMCGRYVRKGDLRKVAEFLEIKNGEENWTESFNVAPSSTIPIVTADLEGRHMIPAVWGFISSMPGRSPLFNARAETVHKLPTFKVSFSSRRCLIPASVT